MSVKKNIPKPVQLLISPEAQDHILKYLKRNSSFKGIRFGVKKTGCSGWGYTVDYIDNILAQDIIIKKIENFVVVITHDDIPFLNNVLVDYKTSGLSSKFYFQNPNQSGVCGCGESFKIDSV